MSIIKICKNTKDANDYLQSVIQDAVDKSKGEVFTVALSGGSLINVLCEVLPQIKTDWQKWLFFFSDERIVSFNDPESTFGLYRKHLAPKLPISLSQFVTIDPSLIGNDCSNDYVSKMRHLCPISGSNELPRLDLILLGMGPDGHTCSLFPGHPANKETSRWVAYVGDSPKPPPNRITLTLPVLNNAEAVVFLVSGNAKAHALKEVLVDQKKLPAGLVKPNSGSLWWIVTSDAAEYIPEETVTKQS